MPRAYLCPDVDKPRILFCRFFAKLDPPIHGACMHTLGGGGGVRRPGTLALAVPGKGVLVCGRDGEGFICEVRSICFPCFSPSSCCSAR